MGKKGRKLLKRAFALMLAVIMAVPAIDYSAVMTVNAEGEVNVSESAGYNEGAYVEWAPVAGANGYQVYVSQDQNDWPQKPIDDELIREYGTYFRADALGLTAGTWYMKVEAATFNENKEKTGTIAQKIVTVTVTAHDRSGYAWEENGTASGAYNEDGSLKSDANVIYITNKTKDTVELNVTGASSNPCVGLQRILHGYKEGKETKSLDVRIIGNIGDFGFMEDGDIVIETYGDKGSAGITIEGVGEDAVANGWGIRIKNAVNVEVRNLGFMNCDSKEGDNIGLQQDNKHIWVHHCDFFYGHAGNDGDQKKGDGMLDCKKSDLITFSYNHFWDSGKCCLLGLREKADDANFVGRITYHHNWFDHSDSRHPRIRYFTTHIYNNYYDGNSKYGIGAAEGGASVFAESNYFKNCKYPMLISQQGSDILKGSGNFESVKEVSSDAYENGSMIKAYDNYIIGEESFIPYQAPAAPESAIQSEGNGFVAYVSVDNDISEETGLDNALNDDVDVSTDAAADDNDINVDTDNVSDDNDTSAVIDDASNNDRANVDADSNDVPNDDNANIDTDKTSDNNADLDADNASSSDENVSADEELSLEEGVGSVLALSSTIDASVDFDAYVVNDRYKTVPDTVKTKKGDFTYNNFDTADGFYKYTPDNVQRVPEIVKANAGRLNGGDFKFEFTADDDSSYAVNEALKAKCTGYVSSLVAVGGINKVAATVYYKVTFDPGNGEDAYDVIVEENCPVDRPVNPAIIPDGKKSFDNWYDGYFLWDFSTKITKDITLKGIWLAEGETPGSYGPTHIGDEKVIHDFTEQGFVSDYFTIKGTLNTKGGSSVEYENTQYTSGNGKGRLDMSDASTEITFTTTTKAKVLLFLATNKDTKKVNIDGVPKTQSNGMIIEEINAGKHTITRNQDNYLYAIWVEPLVSTVTFDTQGGSEVAPQTVADGAKCPKPTDPTREGYTFGGWYKNSECTDDSGFDFDTTPITGDLTLYAKWTKDNVQEPKSYTVTFNTQDGSAVAPQTVADGEKCPKPTDPTREGYTFGGWYKDSGCTDGSEFDFDSTTITGDVTLYAKWTASSTETPTEYIVTFDTKGGSAVESKTVANGEKCPSPAPTPTKENCTFEGWYTDEGCTQAYDFDTPVTGNITLYAKWTPNNDNTDTSGLQISIQKADSYKADGTAQYTYIGSAIMPEIKVTYNGNRLYKDTDYTVKYSNNSSAASKELGTADNKLPTVIVTGKGSYSGKISKTFEILQKNLTDEDVAVSGVVKDETTGAKTITVIQGTKVAPVIYYNSIKLTAKDYDVTGAAGTKYASSDNGKVLTITGKGNYKGSLAFTLNVIDRGEKFTASFNTSDVSNLVYDGAEHKIAPVLNPSSMVKGTDYTVVYSNAVNAGTVKCTVVGLGKYTGCSVTKTYKIKPAVKSSGDFKVAVLPNNGVYTFESQGVTLGDDLKVYIGEEKPENLLTLGKDYKVAYSNNKKVSTDAKKAICKITFLGNYKGSKAISQPFTINKALLCNNTKKLDIVFPNKVSNGKPGIYKSVPYVSIDGISLKKSDYNVEYYTDDGLNTPMDSGHKVSAGETVYVKITGKGNYESTPSDYVKTKYEVQNKPADAIGDLSKATVTLKDKKREYTGSAQVDNVEEIIVKVNGTKTPIPSEKFEENGIKVQYVNNKIKGKATIVISGNGNKYVGSKTTTFNITACRFN